MAQTEKKESPCEACGAINCRSAKECNRWITWFTQEWRKIRIDLGVEKER